MKQDEFINALHNTIDMNKQEIYDLTKKGTIELELKFRISAEELVAFEINTKKLATEEFDKLKPFMFMRERDDINGK